MFMNKVNVKDLFSTNGRQQESSDSAVDSGSQNNYSQYPFSQLEDSQLTQDFGSQHSGESPSRKFYQRYSSASKAQLFGKEANQKQQAQGARPGSNQQLQISKARAKERDERDLLQTLVTSVKDCTAEVKGVVVMVNETLQDGTSKSEEKLKEYLEKLQAGLTKYNESLVHYLQTKDSSETKILELTREVAEKDGRIAELEKQLEKIKRENFDKLLEDMEDIYKEHHCQLQTHVFATTSEQQKTLNQHAQQQEKYLQKLLQHNSNHTTQVVEQFKDKTLALMDERFEAGVNSQMNALKKQLSREVQDEIYSLQSVHRKKIEELINQQVQQLHSVGIGNQNDLMEKQRQQLQQLQNQHRESLENVINEKISTANMEQKSQMELFVEQLWRQEKKRTDAQHQEQMKHFKEQIRQYYEQTLGELKQRHMKEVESIIAQQKALSDRDGNDEYGPFYASQRQPYRSYETDMEVDYQRGRRLEYHGSYDRRFRSLSPAQQFNRTNSDAARGTHRGRYPVEMYAPRDHHPLNRSPALCNVVDPIMLSPKPYPGAVGNNLDKLFSHTRPMSTSSSATFTSPLSVVSHGLNSKMLFSKSVTTPVTLAKEQSEENKTSSEESQNTVKEGTIEQRKSTKAALPKRKGSRAKRKKKATKETRNEESNVQEEYNKYDSDPESFSPESNSKTQDKNAYTYETRSQQQKQPSQDLAKKSRVSQNHSKDITPYEGDARNIASTREQKTKSTPQHIRFSPPMYNGVEPHRKSKRIAKETNKSTVESQQRNQLCSSLPLTTTSSPGKNLDMLKPAIFKSPRHLKNIGDARGRDIFEFSDIPSSPPYRPSQNRSVHQTRSSGGDPNNDERWQNACSIGPSQNSQIVTRKTYGRYNNGSVSYHETIMTQVTDNVDGDVDAASQTSSPSMSVTELKIKHFYKTPPQRSCSYQDKWQVSHSPAGFMSTYGGGTNVQLNEVSNNVPATRKLRSKKRDTNASTASEMMYLQTVKKAKRRKTQT